MPTIEPYRDTKLPERFQRWIEVLRDLLRPMPMHTRGSGSPEGAVNGQLGDRYFRTDGTAGTDMLWYKSTDGGDTGWQAYG